MTNTASRATPLSVSSITTGKRPITPSRTKSSSRMDRVLAILLKDPSTASSTAASDPTNAGPRRPPSPAGRGRAAQRGGVGGAVWARRRSAVSNRPTPESRPSRHCHRVEATSPLGSLPRLAGSGLPWAADGRSATLSLASLRCAHYACSRSRAPLGPGPLITASEPAVGDVCR